MSVIGQLQGEIRRLHIILNRYRRSDFISENEKLRGMVLDLKKRLEDRHYEFEDGEFEL